MSTIRRVLVANRGEIARRIMRTCRRMGVATVAVFSDADAGAPHVREADDARRIGPPPATESYLCIPAILEAARHTRADAIHPGYGFLSENADFADACAEAGVMFIGPPAAVIRAMGSKTAARHTMAAAGVPVVPGATPTSQDPQAIAATVASVGYPALLKASAGGGGKGMRVVRSADGIDEAIAAARRESERAFGDGTLYVERLIERARHIEVQVMGDAHGNVVHVFERDCTLQRRHQKVIEEAPAPTLTPAVRARLLQSAVEAARAVRYVSAGTIEFILEGDGDEARFYFLEMNTRLQVEHPVTEAITGLDLVHAQIVVASGGRLPFSQSDVAVRGHAVECRIYAEDPRRLLPQSGQLLRYREPSGDGIRVDSGVVEGQAVTVHYDPMIAKLIVHGPSREAAIAGARRALGEFQILGVTHNVGFLRALLAHADVAASRVHTRFIEDHLDAFAPAPAAATIRAAAAVAAAIATGVTATASDGEASSVDPWDTIGPIEWVR